jgi:hypothetical protein
VVGQREDVEARVLVVANEQGRGQLSVRVRRVGMKSAPKPHALLGERILHRRRA